MNVVVAPRTSNVSRHKPATQSSVSEWSFGKTVQADAAVATNGDTTSPTFCHTNDEETPWWQVDLGDCFVVEQLRIFNRRDLPARLRRFTVLVSLSGTSGSWLEIGRKNNDVVFGEGNDIPFVLRPKIRTVARFVRIRKDEPGFLHFRECDVLGYSPDAKEMAVLLEQAEQIRQRQGETLEEAEHRKKQAEIQHVGGRTGYVKRIDEHTIFIDTENYSPGMVRALESGAYEGSERNVIPAIVQPTDRVLEIGTAIGVVTMTLAAIVGPDNVMTYDANPAMVSDARRNFAANEMSDISANVGVMRNRNRWSTTESEIDFFVSRDFWGSRLAASAESPDITGVVRVPLVCLEHQITKHQANVLVCDIEGGEADLLDGADLASIRAIMLEIHPWTIGRQRIDDMIRFLVLSGFNIDFSHSSNNIVALDRSA
jgi:FkbM family methyltransferase